MGSVKSQFSEGDRVVWEKEPDGKWKVHYLWDSEWIQIIQHERGGFASIRVPISEIKPFNRYSMVKQAVREVLLSEDFLKAFAAAFRSKTVLQYTFSDEVRSLEHPIPGVNRPMRNEAQLSQMVEMVRQSLTIEPANPSESPNSSIEPPKRYRTPTIEDLANGPIECEVSMSDNLYRNNAILVHVSNKHEIPFLAVDPDTHCSNRFRHCRIEVKQ